VTRGAERLAVGQVVGEVGAQDEPEDVVHLRGGLDQAVAAAVLAEGLAAQLERAEGLPALRAVDAGGEGEGRVPLTPVAVVLAVVVAAATGATEELGVRGRTHRHGKGSRPPCATRRSYHWSIASGVLLSVTHDGPEDHAHPARSPRALADLVGVGRSPRTLGVCSSDRRLCLQPAFRLIARLDDNLCSHRASIAGRIDLNAALSPAWNARGHGGSSGSKPHDCIRGSRLQASMQVPGPLPS